MQTIWALVWAQFLVGYPLVLWWLLGTALFNLIGHRSQVDAWCEQRPRVAAVLKLMRGIGFDPWLILQGWSLFVRGKLPERMRYFPYIAGLLLLTGCTQTPEACTQSALDAQITACAEAIYQAPDADKERVHAGCIAALDGWKARCL